jgi:predicted HD superfamily hydrolase involved in NAD metabolism
MINDKIFYKKIIYIENNLSKFISKKRIEHSKRVSLIAKDLAKIYGENELEAVIAGLLHDSAKEIQIKDYNKYNIKLKKSEQKLLCFGENICHAFASREIARNFFNIKNKKILKAIESHTIGNTSMTILDKIIFVSDLIDPKNDYKEIDEIRNIANKDITKATILSFSFVFRYLINNQKKICLNSIKSWNSL